MDKWSWGNWTATLKKMKLDTYLTPYTKVNSKWIEDLNVRPETKNLLELKIGNKLLGDDILDLTPKAKEIRKKVGLHQTKKPLNSKGNHQQNKKVTYWMGENIFKLYTWYEVNMQNI